MSAYFLSGEQGEDDVPKYWVETGVESLQCQIREKAWGEVEKVNLLRILNIYHGVISSLRVNDLDAILRRESQVEKWHKSFIIS